MLGFRFLLFRFPMGIPKRTQLKMATKIASIVIPVNNPIKISMCIFFVIWPGQGTFGADG
jgi:hypothetical protein